MRAVPMRAVPTCVAVLVLPRVRVRVPDTVAWMVVWTTPLRLATPLHVVMLFALVLSVPMPMPLNAVLALLVASHGHCAVKDTAQIT